MTNNVKVWLGLFVFYGVFYSWYVGFDHKIDDSEAVVYLEKLKVAMPDIDEVAARNMISTDDGTSLVVVNLIKFNEPKKESLEAFDSYSEPFMAELFKAGGHPVFYAKGPSSAFEYWGLAPGAEEWDLALAVRYRSMRDLLDLITWPEFSEVHPYKKLAIEKTIAFPARPWTVLGGIPLSLMFVLIIIGLLLTRKRRG